MIYYIKGGNPNDCDTYPFCPGNSACKSGKCPPAAPIDDPLAILFLIIGGIMLAYFSIQKIKDKYRK
jgi:hypothetical protein